MNKSLALVRVADGIAHATAPVNLNGDLLRAHMVEPLGEQAQLAAPTHQELMATTKQRRRRRSTRPPDATTVSTILRYRYSLDGRATINVTPIARFSRSRRPTSTQGIGDGGRSGRGREARRAAAGTMCIR